MNKAVMIICLLLTPAILQADKYEDVNGRVREVLIVLSQISIQGKDAATFSQVQQALVRIGKDVADLGKEYEATRQEVADLGKEYEATRQEVVACKEKEVKAEEAASTSEASPE